MTSPFDAFLGTVTVGPTGCNTGANSLAPRTLILTSAVELSEGVEVLAPITLKLYFVCVS